MSDSKFGPDPVTVTSLFNIDPQVLEGIAQWIEQRGLRTPVSQVVGFTQFNAQPADPVNATESTTSTSYGDLTTVGPSLSKLSDGRYIVFFGAKFFGESTGASGYMALSANGAGASDSDAIKGGGPDNSTDALPPVSLSRALAVTLSNGSNTIVAKYRSDVSGTAATFDQRWMIALRYGNP